MFDYLLHIYTALGLTLLILGIIAFIMWFNEMKKQKLSDRLSRSFKPGESYDDVRFRDYEK